MINGFPRLIIMTSLLLCFPLAGAAHAADELQLSRDGVSWASSLRAPLFDETMRWVPGDSETATFFVRHRGDGGAALIVEAMSRDADALLGRGDLTIRARAGGGSWVDLPNRAPSLRLNHSDVPEGVTIPVDVNVTFDAASTNQSQRAEASIVLRVRLAAAVGGDSSDLPITGSAVSPALVLLAVTIAGAGIALVRASRQEEADV